MVGKPGATAVAPTDVQVQGWLAYRNRRKEAGASLWAIAGELASPPSTGFCQATIYYYLSPAAREKDRQCRRRRRRAREQPDTAYQRRYRRITRPRSQERILRDLYARANTLTLNEIADALPSLTLIGGVRFQPQTIERRLLEGYLEHQAKGRIRGPPPYLALIDPATRTWYFGNDPPPSERTNSTR